MDTETKPEIPQDTSGFPGDTPNLPQPAGAGGAVIAYDFGEDEGVGMRGLEMSEQLIPFISILQGLSPQINPSKPEFIQGAQLGMLFNTATKALYPMTGMTIIPVWREHQFTEWVPRDDIQYPDGRTIKGGAGGGFRGIHDPNSKEVIKAKDDALAKYGRSAAFRPLPFFNEEQKEDTVLIDQFNLGILYGYPELNDDTVRRGMIAFTSTKIGVYRAFITACDDIKYRNPRTGRMAAPPMWAHRWKLSTVPQSNKKGDFFNYRIALEATPPEKAMVPMNSPLYAVGKEFYKQWEQGAVKGDYSSAEAGNQEGRAPLDTESGEIPF